MYVHRAQLYLRVAYAGPPLSGKTATLKALLTDLHGESAGASLFSPLAARGRTLYFDWGQYQGGNFLDGPLHCQLTSVPGQASLQRRRRLLIEDADVVVFVVDSQSDQMEANRRSFEELTPWLRRDPLPPIGVVFQANKRDLEDALPFEAIRQGLGLGQDVQIFPSSALRGEGVRFCFVAAARECVRRAEALRASDQLPKGEPPVTSGEQLLQRLRDADGHEAPPPAPGAPGADTAGKSESQPAAGEPESQQAVVQPLSAMPPRRPAVMPMAEWLAGEAERERTLEAAGTAAAAAQQAAQPQDGGGPLPPPVLSLTAARTSRELRAHPQPETAPAGTADPPAPEAAAPLPYPTRNGRRYAVMPMADWQAAHAVGLSAAGLAAAPAPAPAPPRPPLQFPATSMLATSATSATSATPAPPTLTPPTAPPTTLTPAAQTSAAAPSPPPPRPLGRATGASGIIRPPASLSSTELPAPWLPGREQTLVEAWPPALWREVQRAVSPKSEAPAAVGATLQARVGGGWQARAWGILPALDLARTEFSRLVTWLMRLGDTVSRRRCIVLAASARGWCVWQIVRQELTFDLLIRQSIEEDLLSKDAVQVLARVAADYVASATEFMQRGIELPIHLKTLAHEDRSTVYCAFLPPAPVPLATHDPLTDLAAELRVLLPPHLLGTLNVTEALRELELLSDGKPHILPTIELLQSLLIGE